MNDLSAGRLNVQTALFPFKGEKFNHMKKASGFRNQMHLIHCVLQCSLNAGSLITCYSLLERSCWTCTSGVLFTGWMRSACLRAFCHLNPRQGGWSAAHHMHTLLNRTCTHALRLPAQRQGSKHPLIGGQLTGCFCFFVFCFFFFKLGFETFFNVWEFEPFMLTYGLIWEQWGR